MRTKYLNEITITLLVVTGLAVIVSAGMMIAEAKEFAAAKAEQAAVPIKVPLVTRQVVPYSLENYQAIQRLINELPIKADAMPDKLIISSSNIDNESQWSRVVSEVLALDRNLQAVRICGSSTNACSGVALVAEIVGQRQKISVIN